MRRSDRAKKPPQRRRAGMIDAARRWKARATAGCAQAPDLKPQAGPRASPAKHGRADSTNEARRSASERLKILSPFTKMEKSQQICFETVLSLTRLSASRRQTMRQMVDERGGTPNGPSRRKANCSVIKWKLWRLRAHAVARHHSRPSMTGAPPFRNLRNRSHG